MATISTTDRTIPNDKAAELRDAIAYEHGYTDTVDDGAGNQIPNPVSKTTYAQQIVDQKFDDWLRNTYRQYKHRLAQETADISIPIT